MLRRRPQRVVIHNSPVGQMDFCITATLRPEILRETLRSFNTYLTGIQLKQQRVFINVDPAPENRCSAKDVAAVAQEYFGTVVLNAPEQPNFCAAVKWLWLHAETPLIFHLEDDWEMLKPTNIGDVVRLLRTNARLNQVRLRKPSSETAMTDYGLSPTVLKLEFCRKIANGLDIARNPERQMRKDFKRLGIQPPSASTILPYPIRVPLIIKANKRCAMDSYVLVRDIGKDWRREHGMSKPPKDEENVFTKWHYRKDIIR